MEKIEEWSVEGGWFDVCRCEVPCPCSWAQPADDGFCEGILVWHIAKGHYGAVTLDGLNVVVVGAFKGNVWENPDEFVSAIFMDERADEGQRGALQIIFSGQGGGWPKRFSEVASGEVKGMAFAPITVHIAPDLSSWRAAIPGHVLAEAKALTGPTSNGKFLEIRNLPGSEVGPGGIATWGKAMTDRADAFGLKWDHGAGKSSKYISFAWNGPDPA